MMVIWIFFSSKVLRYRVGRKKPHFGISFFAMMAINSQMLRENLVWGILPMASAVQLLIMTMMEIPICTSPTLARTSCTEMKAMVLLPMHLMRSAFQILSGLPAPPFSMLITMAGLTFLSPIMWNILWRRIRGAETRGKTNGPIVTLMSLWEYQMFFTIIMVTALFQICPKSLML